nr:hypothetical protein [Morchella crassipes]
MQRGPGCILSLKPPPPNQSNYGSNWTVGRGGCSRTLFPPPPTPPRPPPFTPPPLRPLLMQTPDESRGYARGGRGKGANCISPPPPPKGPLPPILGTPPPFPPHSPPLASPPLPNSLNGGDARGGRGRGGGPHENPLISDERGLGGGICYPFITKGLVVGGTLLVERERGEGGGKLGGAMAAA